MSLTGVKTQLTRIVEQTTPTTKARGLPPSFKRVATPSDPLDGRRFYFELLDLGVLGPHIPITADIGRSVDSMRLVICYPEDLGGDEVDDHIHADYVAVIRRLLDSGLWRFEKSGIISISPEPAGRLLISPVERETGIIRLSIPFLVEHQL